MSWGAVAGAAIGVVGGMMSSSKAKDAANKQAATAQEQMAALKEASKFVPTGTTNRFGTTAQVINPETGQLQSQQFNMSPEMLAYQKRLQDGSNQALPGGFNPEEATQAQYQLLKNQQAPGVERRYSGLLSGLMQNGTMGLSTGGTAGVGGTPAMMQSNPQMEAFMNAVAQQDATNLTNAQTQSRSMMDSDIARSNGLMDQMTNIENQGQTALNNNYKVGADQRDATMRGAGATASQGNLAASLTADANGGSMWGSLLSGVASNKQFAPAVSSFFGTTADPNPNLPTRSQILARF